MSATRGLFECARQCLLASEADEKITLTRQVHRDWGEGLVHLKEAEPPCPVDVPGRPPRPQLVHPRELARRTPAHERGRAVLVHAVTHIEFNAINLAWDAVYRFRDLPRGYYSDWIQVAEDETRHFLALRGRLRDMGFEYGDFPAHNGLWDMAQRTDHDLLARMALVPRVLEARGLDVTPGMIRRFQAAGDDQTAEVLEMILREEVAHVAAGSRWFRYVCAERDLQPEPVFFQLLQTYLRGEVRCPLHREARLAAGFSEAELARLEQICAGG